MKKPNDKSRTLKKRRKKDLITTVTYNTAPSDWLNNRGNPFLQKKTWAIEHAKWLLADTCVGLFLVHHILHCYVVFVFKLCFLSTLLVLVFNLCFRPIRLFFENLNLKFQSTLHFEQIHKKVDFSVNKCIQKFSMKEVFCLYFTLCDAPLCRCRVRAPSKAPVVSFTPTV